MYYSCFFLYFIFIFVARFWVGILLFFYGTLRSEVGAQAKPYDATSFLDSTFSTMVFLTVVTARSAVLMILLFF